MRRITTRQRQRRGFTLIELLVVIAIIGILVSLTMVAVMPILRRGPEVQTTAEIRQLSVALETFKTKFGAYPPSRFRLLENASLYNTAISPTTGLPVNQLDFDSKNFLQRIFPRIQFPQDWNGDGKYTGDWTLEGHECLVFFLGGVQQIIPPPVGSPPGTLSTGLCLGFSNDPRNPATFTGARLGPYFEFDSSRIVLPATVPYSQVSPPVGLAYQDFFGKGNYYAYFSSGNNPNGYNAYPTATSPTSDCPSLGVSPYAQSGPTVTMPTLPFRYYNPNTFQIITAGADGIFGSGGLRPPGGPVMNGPPPLDQGADDFSNFAGGRLGAGL